MAAGAYDFQIEQGSTWNPVLTWKDENQTPIDLTDCAARLQARPAIDSATVTLDLSTGNGKITLGGQTGKIVPLLSAAETAALNFTRLVYDLEVTMADGTVLRLLEGAITLSREVTR